MHIYIYMHKRIHQELVGSLRKDIGLLLTISDVISLLDMLLSFAQTVSMSDKYTRPEFKANGPLAIREGSHPMASMYCADIDGQGFVPNNTFLGNPCRCCILTGALVCCGHLRIKQVHLYVSVS